MMYRPDWDEYFLVIAEAVRRRADCRRGQYGAVIVDEYHRIVSTGYNGSAVGGPSCLQGGCPRGLLSNEECKSFLEGNHDYSNCISLHAEVNAIAYADGDKMRGGTIYITGPPCDMCGKLIKAAGITRVVHP